MDDLVRVLHEEADRIPSTPITLLLKRAANVIEELQLEIVAVNMCADLAIKKAKRLEKTIEEAKQAILRLNTKIEAVDRGIDGL